MPLALELGDIKDPAIRRALETIMLRWPDPPTAPVVYALPARGAQGQVVFIADPPASAGLYVWSEQAGTGKWTRMTGVAV